MKYCCCIPYRFHLIISILLISSYLKAGGLCNNESPSAGYVTVHNKTDMAIVMHPYYFYNNPGHGESYFDCQKVVDAKDFRKIYWEYPLGMRNSWRMRARYIIFYFKADTKPKDILNISLNDSVVQSICDISTDGTEGKLTDCNKIVSMNLNNRAVRLQLSNTCPDKKSRECDLYIGYPEK